MRFILNLEMFSEMEFHNSVYDGIPKCTPNLHNLLVNNFSEWYHWYAVLNYGRIKRGSIVGGREDNI